MSDTNIPINDPFLLEKARKFSDTFKDTLKVFDHFKNKQQKCMK